MNIEVESSDRPGMFTSPGVSLFKGFPSATPFIPGRRKFFKYRDLGVKAATNGRARAVLNTAIESLLEPTGWHYHTCDFQFIYCIAGTVVLEFEDGTIATFTQGDSFIIPGGFRHNEIYLSEDRVSLEFSVPGEIGTVSVERPAFLPEKLTPVGTNR